jgi:hypothetical protein
VKLFENFGEWEFQHRVFGAQNGSLEFVETGFVCGDVDVAGAGVEQPNVTHSHGELFVDVMAQLVKRSFGERIPINKNGAVCGRPTYICGPVAEMRSSL